MNKEIIIKYEEFAQADELARQDRELLSEAEKATDGSYAPYSDFHVGAAIRLDNGEIISAANQENAAYPSGLCAERSAVFYAHSKFPNIPINAIAIIAKQNGETTSEPAMPCGACRQVLSESQKRGKKPVKIILGGKNRIFVFNSLDDLLPFTFDNLDK